MSETALPCADPSLLRAKWSSLFGNAVEVAQRLSSARPLRCTEATGDRRGDDMGRNEGVSWVLPPSRSAICASTTAGVSSGRIVLHRRDRGDFRFARTNGAGKTVTVEILEGHRRRTSGTVSVLGYDP